MHRNRVRKRCIRRFGRCLCRRLTGIKSVCLRTDRQDPVRTYVCMLRLYTRVYAHVLTRLSHVHVYQCLHPYRTSLSIHTYVRTLQYVWMKYTHIVGSFACANVLIMYAERAYSKQYLRNHLQARRTPWSALRSSRALIHGQCRIYSRK